VMLPPIVLFEQSEPEFIVGPQPAPTDWPSLLRASRGLRQLRDDIRTGRYGRTHHEWERAKLYIKALVGRDSRRPELKSSGLFEIAVRELDRIFWRRRGGAR
jgi:hypothetical protein